MTLASREKTKGGRLKPAALFLSLPCCHQILTLLLATPVPLFWVKRNIHLRVTRPLDMPVAENRACPNLVVAHRLRHKSPHRASREALLSIPPPDMPQTKHTRRKFGGLMDCLLRVNVGGSLRSREVPINETNNDGNDHNDESYYPTGHSLPNDLTIPTCVSLCRSQFVTKSPSSQC